LHMMFTYVSSPEGPTLAHIWTVCLGHPRNNFPTHSQTSSRRTPILQSQTICRTSWWTC
jgi:hypothetical protein